VARWAVRARDLWRLGCGGMGAPAKLVGSE